MSSSSVTHVPGVRLGSYELGRLLGEGAMGRVFEARHVRLGRRVAVKTLRDEHAKDPALVQRFFQEARAVNRVNHPNLVAIEDFIEETDEHGNARAYCVMELLEGQTLSELMAEGPLPLRRTLAIVEQVCRALSAAHAVGVVHRDLKPENVFISRAPDGSDFAKVLDFGVAKLLKPDPAVSLKATYEGAVIGTPLYMSPEQAASLPVDARTDVYGVGCLLYELLVARAPFQADDLGSLLARILTRAPDALGPRTASGEAIPPALDDLVSGCLEKQPDARPPSAEAVRERLESLLCGRAERRRQMPFSGPVAALSAGAALVLTLIVFARANDARADARAEGRAEAVAEAVQRAPDVELQAARAPAAASALPPVSSVVEPVTVKKASASKEKQTVKSVVQRGRKGPAQGKGRKRRSSPTVGVSRDAVLDPFLRP